MIHQPQPCGVLFTVKILSHIATAALVLLMSVLKEHLKALFQQLCLFDVGEMDIPPDLQLSPRINTVVWRLNRRALYSLNTEIHTASVSVPLFLLSPPHPSFIYCFLSFWPSPFSAAFETQPLSSPRSFCFVSSVSVPFTPLKRGPMLLLTSACHC